MKTVLTVTLLCLLVGCSSIPETKYYILAPASQAVESAVANDREVLSIGTIRLADYLRQPGIITQTSDFEIHSAHYHLWAEPLSQGVRRNLAQQLTTTMVGYRIEQGPIVRSDVAYRLDLEIDQFHTAPGGVATLNGRWTLYCNRDKKFAVSEVFAFREPLGAAGFGAAVAAQSKLLTRLGNSVSATAESPLNCRQQVASG